MASDNVINVQSGGTSVQSLPPEYTAECAVVLLAYLGDDRVHCPAVELLVGKDFEG